MSIKTEIPAFNQNLLGVTLRRQQALQRETGKNWWYRESFFARLIAVLYEISFYFTLLWNGMIMSNYAMKIARYRGAESFINERAIYQNAFRSFLFGTFLFIAAYVFKKLAAAKKEARILLKNRLYFASFLIAAVGCVFLAVTAYQVLVNAHIDEIYATAVERTTSGSVYLKFAFLHAVPLFIFLLSNALFYFMNRFDFKEKIALYNRISERLFKEFTAENPSYSQAQWEDFLNHYKDEPNDRVLKSKKKRRKRQKSERQ